MGATTLEPGTRFRWGDDTFAILGPAPDGSIKVEDLATTLERTIALPEFERALFAGQVRITATYRAADATVSHDPDGFLPWEDYTEHERAVASVRQEIVGHVLEERLGRGALAVYIEQLRDGWRRKPLPDGMLIRDLSLATVYRWKFAYEAAGGDIRALIPDTRDRGVFRPIDDPGAADRRAMPSALRDIIARATDENWLRTVVGKRVRIRRPAIKKVADLVELINERIAVWNAAHPAAEPLPDTNAATVGRHLRAISPRKRIEAAEGKRAAARAARQVNPVAPPANPLERVEIDHTLIPVIVVDERGMPLGRPVLTFAVDVATRYPLGYSISFERFSYYAVAQCLYHAFRPKTGDRDRYGTEHEWLAYGIPFLLVTDNGREFRGKSLRAACKVLHIDLRHLPRFTPEMKGTVEEGIKRIKHALFFKLPGAVFRTLKELKGYDGVKNACLTLADLDRLVFYWFVDIYAETPHPALDNDTPAARWQTLARDPYRFVRRYPCHSDDLRSFLNEVVERRISKSGIEIETLFYNTDALGDLRLTLKEGETVAITIPSGDIGAIRVRDPRTGEYLDVPAVAQHYASGLSRWTHRLLRKRCLESNKMVNLAGLQAAKDGLWAMVAKMMKPKRTNATAARIATQGASARDLPPTPSAAIAPRGKSRSAGRPAASAIPNSSRELEELLAGQTADAAGWGFDTPEKAGPAAPR
jgi:putative transposase